MIVLFDGVCNFCSASVQFIIERDRKNVFQFAALQSDAAKKLLSERGIAPPERDPDSILLIDGDRVHSCSGAALRIARHLSFPWFLAWGFIVVPWFLRDPFYRLIAKNRYRWWGRKESCMVPTPDVRAKFL
jgi:predicted DCC family thiol-disulfide oxidoreductase YuxK